MQNCAHSRGPSGAFTSRAWTLRCSAVIARRAPTRFTARQTAQFRAKPPPETTRYPYDLCAVFLSAEQPLPNSTGAGISQGVGGASFLHARARPTRSSKLFAIANQRNPSPPIRRPHSPIRPFVRHRGVLGRGPGDARWLAALTRSGQAGSLWGRTAGTLQWFMAPPLFRRRFVCSLLLQYVLALIFHGK